jgi:diamine N-acetyltransferase
MEPEDLDWLYRIENDMDSWAHGVTNVPYSRYALRDFIAHSTGDIYTDGQVRMIVETAEGEPVGVADMMSFDAKNNRAEVGIIIERQYRGKGYGTQSLALLADYALRILHLHQLYAVVALDNEKSLRVFEKAGFSKSTLLRDWLYDGKQYHEAALMQKML